MTILGQWRPSHRDSDVNDPDFWAGMMQKRPLAELAKREWNLHLETETAWERHQRFGREIQRFVRLLCRWWQCQFEENIVVLSLRISDRIARNKGSRRAFHWRDE
ncbi:MAG: hypothetical protein HQL60_02395 [Magnetococcales bacterium]|nr:hypothetical protein [Magnetococcales bacterium]